MNITRMTASFGRLEKQTLELSPGLNILQAPNEGGKSTWAAFLRVMLYGIDTRERDKKGSLADKNRFRPWSGTPMEGVLECRWQGRPLILRRWTGSSAPMGCFSAVWGDTDQPVEGMTGDNAGQLLTGVGREVFERSAFLRQSGLAVDQAPELERRIAALVTSGQEDVSFSQADGRLREWLRRRRHNKTGQIPRLEGELAETEATLGAMEQATGEIAAARAELEELKGIRTELEGQLDIHRRLARREVNRRYAQARQAARQAEEELAAAEEALSAHGAPPEREGLLRAQEQLAALRAAEAALRSAEEAAAGQDDRALLARTRDPRFPDLTIDEMWQTAQDDYELLHSYRENRIRRRRRTIPLVAAAALVGLLAGWLLWLKHPELLMMAVIAALGVPAVVNSVCRTLSRQQEAREQADIGEILSQHQVADEDEILPRAMQAREDALAARQELKALLQRRAEAAAAREERDGQLARLLEYVHTFAPEVTDQFGAAAAVSRALTLLERRKEARLRADSARQLADTLAAQGGQETDTLEELTPPAEDAAALQARLGATEQEMGRVQTALDTAQGRQTALGDPARLTAQASQLRETLAHLEEDYSALETALDALHCAEEGLRGRFSPALNQRAGELMSVLTGGRYTSVTLDRAFDASAEQAGGLVPRPALSLSQGTADQLYLAVRLAICQLVLPEEEPCPLVLDDALTNFDDQRLALALSLLEQLAARRQILLFTCHGREAALLAGRPAVTVRQL